MKQVYIFILVALGATSFKATAQENVFLTREYWKANPTIGQIEKDMALGHDISAMTGAAFDPVCWAFLEKTDNETIKYLLTKEGNGVNKRTHDGRTYIFWAAYKGNLEMMEYLVAKGAKTDLIDSHGYSLLNFTAVTGQRNIQLYDFCIANGADPKMEKNKDGANALLLVAPFLEDEDLIDYFTAKGIDLHDTDTMGNGIFNYAAKKGNTEILDLLIKKGVDYKTKNKEGGNAFIFASQGTRNSANTLKTYKYLETLGIQPNISTDNGFTPLHALAYRNTDLEIFNYFIEKGVDVNQPDQEGNTPFINAAYRNDLQSVAFLAEHVKDINVRNKKGTTPLMRALQRNTMEVVRFLLKRGADTSAKDAQGNTMVYYALQSFNGRNPKRCYQKLDVLKEKGVDMALPQGGGQTLWHLAVKENNMSLLQKVATMQIPINHKNDGGVTALHLAAMKAADAKILKFLLSQGADKTIKTDFDETVYDLAHENELLQKQHITLNFLQ